MTPEINEQYQMLRMCSSSMGPFLEIWESVRAEFEELLSHDAAAAKDDTS